MHAIYELKCQGKALLRKDFDPHWWYKRSTPCIDEEEEINNVLLMQNPLPVKGKGHPKGALGCAKTKSKPGEKSGSSSTRRAPSLHEYDNVSPPSTAPAALGVVVAPGATSTYVMNPLQRKRGHEDSMTTTRDIASLEGIRVSKRSTKGCQQNTRFADEQGVTATQRVTALASHWLRCAEG
jgi:hypothetical protein